MAHRTVTRNQQVGYAIFSAMAALFFYRMAFTIQADEMEANAASVGTAAGNNVPATSTSDAAPDQSTSTDPDVLTAAKQCIAQLNANERAEKVDKDTLKGVTTITNKAETPYMSCSRETNIISQNADPEARLIYSDGYRCDFSFGIDTLSIEIMTKTQRGPSDTYMSFMQDTSKPPINRWIHFDSNGRITSQDQQDMSQQDETKGTSSLSISTPVPDDIRALIPIASKLDCLEGPA